MNIMIEKIREYMFIDAWMLCKQYETGKYKEISDCPKYKTVKAYCDAINVLSEVCYKKEYLKKFTITPERIIKEGVFE